MITNWNEYIVGFYHITVQQKWELLFKSSIICLWFKDRSFYKHISTGHIGLFWRQADGSFWVWGYYGLHSEFQDTNGYLERSCLNQKEHLGNYSIYHSMEFFPSLIWTHL